MLINLKIESDDISIFWMLKGLFGHGNGPEDIREIKLESVR